MAGVKRMYQVSYRIFCISVRQTKLAYVDVSAKPPRGVRRAQVKNGTGGSMRKQVGGLLHVNTLDLAFTGIVLDSLERPL